MGYLTEVVKTVSRLVLVDPGVVSFPNKGIRFVPTFLRLDLLLIESFCCFEILTQSLHA